MKLDHVQVVLRYHVQVVGVNILTSGLDLDRPQQVQDPPNSAKPVWSKSQSGMVPGQILTHTIIIDKLTFSRLQRVASYAPKVVPVQLVQEQHFDQPQSVRSKVHQFLPN